MNCSMTDSHSVSDKSSLDSSSHGRYSTQSGQNAGEAEVNKDSERSQLAKVLGAFITAAACEALIPEERYSPDIRLKQRCIRVQ